MTFSDRCVRHQGRAASRARKTALEDGARTVAPPAPAQIMEDAGDGTGRASATKDGMARIVPFPGQAPEAQARAEAQALVAERNQAWAAQVEVVGRDRRRGPDRRQTHLLPRTALCLCSR